MDDSIKKASANGASPALSNAEQNDSTSGNGRAETMHQAEEMADRLMERIGGFAGWLSREVLRLTARAREEAADIWAEAEHLRKSGFRSQESEVSSQESEQGGTP
jgi:hypothetical protein